MGRKRSENSSRNYFTKETEDYIVQYNSESDPEKKSKIFREHLYYPFYKLAENIINTFKFYHTDTETIEDLKLDVISMVVLSPLIAMLNDCCNVTRNIEIRILNISFFSKYRLLKIHFF